MASDSLLKAAILALVGATGSIVGAALTLSVILRAVIQDESGLRVYDRMDRAHVGEIDDR